MYRWGFTSDAWRRKDRFAKLTLAGASELVKKYNRYFRTTRSSPFPSPISRIYTHTFVFCRSLTHSSADSLAPSFTPLSLPNSFLVYSTVFILLTMKYVLPFLTLLSLFEGFHSTLSHTLPHTYVHPHTCTYTCTYRVHRRWRGRLICFTRISGLNIFH